VARRDAHRIAHIGPVVGSAKESLRLEQTPATASSSVSNKEISARRCAEPAHHNQIAPASLGSRVRPAIASIAANRGLSLDRKRHSGHHSPGFTIY
jgi:hypothetical protein